MSGFLGMTTRPWIRRIVTRLIAITPAMIAACLAGRSGLSHMLVASQVALSIQLPFAVIPLVYFTYKKEAMSLDLVVLKKNQEKVSKPSILDYIRSKFSSSDGWVAFSETNDKEKELVQSDHSSSNSETETTTTTIGGEQLLKEIPTPLSYENSKLVNVCAVLVSTLLVGLNSYLVVTLFMQI
jgi:Mn2+/Fe2+ NRAMP family transporter